MSDLFVDNIKHQSSQGSGTITIGTSGETIQAASGATNNIGIGMVDQWRLNNDIAGVTANTVISTNLERVDDASWGGIGTGMSESSGIFTFPQTGIYQVTFIGSVGQSTGNESRYIGFQIDVTTDNSTYNRRAQNYVNLPDVYTSTAYATGITSTLVDVTDTTQVKVRFLHQWQENVGATLHGDSDYNRTIFTFIRLGDT